jgi:hypothetical protein
MKKMNGKKGLVLTASFILAIKSRGLPEPLACLEAGMDASLGFAAEKSWSRNIYSAASATPIDRIKRSEEEVAITGTAGEKVVLRLTDVIA